MIILTFPRPPKRPKAVILTPFRGLPVQILRPHSFPANSIPALDGSLDTLYHTLLSRTSQGPYPQTLKIAKNDQIHTYTFQNLVFDPFLAFLTPFWSFWPLFDDFPWFCMLFQTNSSQSPHFDLLEPLLDLFQTFSIDKNYLSIPLLRDLLHQIDFITLFQL